MTEPLKTSAPLTQDQLKQLVAEAALAYVVPGAIIGVGTGSTANLFIDALAGIKDSINGVVSSSEASTARLKSHGIPVFDLNEVESLPVYIDGADEINPKGAMIKGGGAALTREKIVTAVAEKFVCIADGSKWVAVLGKFPLPIEVIPMAAAQIIRSLAKLGGQGTVRLKDGAPLITDNGNYIIDVRGMQITDPVATETEINQWPGIVTVGLFARQGANVVLLGKPTGVETIHF